MTLQDTENDPTRLSIENIEKRLQEETKSLENLIFGRKLVFYMNFFGLDIYDENIGTILKSIKSKNSDSISFDGEGNILVLVYMAHELPWLFVYSSNGDFIEKITIPRIQSNFLDYFFYFHIDKNEKLIFLDSHSLILYIE